MWGGSPDPQPTPRSAFRSQPEEPDPWVYEQGPGKFDLGIAESLAIETEGILKAPPYFGCGTILR
jgi:hypothetical protein